MNKRIFGNQAETFVAQHLQKNGYTIVERNYQKRYGEVDIIARKKDVYAFVEVKLRKPSPIPIQASISWSKQRKISLVAREYIARHRLVHFYCRFDAALVHMDEHNQMHLQYIENAFSV